MLPLAVQWNPVSLPALTYGSALGWQCLRTPKTGAQIRSRRVLADYLIGRLSKGALGRPSNPGSRGLVAHQPLLRVPDHPLHDDLLHGGPPSRGAGLRVRVSLRARPRGWVRSCPTPRAARDGVRLARRGRRHAALGRAPRERRSSGSAAPGANVACAAPPWAVRRSRRGPNRCGSE